MVFLIRSTSYFLTMYSRYNGTEILKWSNGHSVRRLQQTVRYPTLDFSLAGCGTVSCQGLQKPCNTSTLPTSKPISYLFDPTLDTNSEDSFRIDLVSLNFGDNAVFTADLSLKILPL